MRQRSAGRVRPRLRLAAEGQLGCKLIERDGARGSTLTPAGERAIAVYEELQADINNVIATKANDLIASIKE